MYKYQVKCSWKGSTRPTLLNRHLKWPITCHQKCPFPLGGGIWTPI